MTTEEVPLAGVLGWPVSHSRSPALHGHWLERYALKGAYLPLPCRPEHLETILRAMPLMGFVGANVTIPHKEAAFALADRATPRAERLRAANTLVFDDETILADNTDGFGFLENLRDAVPDWSPQGANVAVLGAGGAARAVLLALHEAGAARIALANRTRARAEAMAAELDIPVSIVDWAEAGSVFDGASLAVNTTSLGMTGGGAFDVSLDALPSGAIATDLVYTPLETPFLSAAARRGARTVDGLGMLLHQARPGFEAWFGKAPEVDGALRKVVLGV